MKKYDNKTIEKLIFRYFDIRNFEISKFQSFYIPSFKILNPTRRGFGLEVMRKSKFKKKFQTKKPKMIEYDGL